MVQIIGSRLLLRWIPCATGSRGALRPHGMDVTVRRGEIVVKFMNGGDPGQDRGEKARPRPRPCGPLPIAYRLRPTVVCRVVGGGRRCKCGSERARPAFAGGASGKYAGRGRRRTKREGYSLLVPFNPISTCLMVVPVRHMNLGTMVSLRTFDATNDQEGSFLLLRRDDDFGRAIRVMWTRVNPFCFGYVLSKGPHQPAMGTASDFLVVLSPSAITRVFRKIGEDLRHLRAFNNYLVARSAYVNRVGVQVGFGGHVFFPREFAPVECILYLCVLALRVFGRFSAVGVRI